MCGLRAECRRKTRGAQAILFVVAATALRAHRNIHRRRSSDAANDAGRAAIAAFAQERRALDGG
jgi:hypothetical protein